MKPGGSNKGSKTGSHKKVSKSLVAVGSAAVMAVYAAGYTRTRAAAERLEAQSAVRRPAVARPARSDYPIAHLPPAAHAVPVRISSAEPAPPKPHITGAAPSAPVQPAPLVAETKATAAAPAPAPVPAAPMAAVPAPAAPVPAASPASAAPAAPAPAPTQSAAAPAGPAPAGKLRDGTYSGYGTSRHGDIRAEVVIQGGRIISATIADCMTRYSCDIIDKLPPEVPARQSPEVDYVSGATESANAFYYAVVDALAFAQ